MRTLSDPLRTARSLSTMLSELSADTLGDLFDPYRIYLDNLIERSSVESEIVAKPFALSDLTRSIACSASKAFAMSEFVSLMAREHADPSASGITSAAALFMQHCEAIELLCREGLDTQAKVILRSAFEAADLLIVFSEDKDMQHEYVAVEDGEAAKAFWSKHLFRGRLFSRSNEIFARHVPAPIVNLDIAAWKNAEVEFLGRSVHPSHTAGFMSIMGNSFSALAADGHVDALTLGGERHVGSIRTSHALALQSARLYGVYSERPIATFDETKPVEGAPTVGKLGFMLLFLCAWGDAIGHWRVRSEDGLNEVQPC